MTIRVQCDQSVNLINAENIRHLAEINAQGKAKIILAEAQAYKEK